MVYLKQHLQQKNKNDAIKKLGSRAFGFASQIKNTVNKDITMFYLRIWFETLGKDKENIKISSIINKLNSIN